MRLGKWNILFLLVLVLAIGLRFWGLNNEDIQSDAAVNSVRALGWFDFLTGQGQTSPIIWFGEIPGWARLSFHDHPPLVFAVQHIFLRIFGESSRAVLSSFALAAVATTILLYALVKKFRSPQEALLAALAFATSSYAVWASRTGYLEGIEILLVTASIYFFLRFVSEGQNRLWVWWVAMTGLALLSKYTAIFLLPAAFLYLLLWQRNVFRNKRFWFSLLLFLVILAPVIIYNFQLYQTRGHFDAALSSMLGRNPEDYAVLTRRVNFGLAGNLATLWEVLRANTSWPFLALEVLALGYLVLAVWRKRADVLQKVLLLNLLMLAGMFAFSGLTARFLTIALPLLSVALGLLIGRIWGELQIRRPIWKTAGVVILLAVFGWELLYAVNTNLLPRPVGQIGIFYSPERFYQTGFQKLDRYLRQNAYGTLPKRKTVTKLTDVLNYDLRGREVILFDDRPDWNMRMWYVHRYQSYYDVPLVYLSDVLTKTDGQTDIFEYLLEAGATGFWLVAAEGPAVNREEFTSYNNLIAGITAKLEEAGIAPRAEILSYTGETAFKVYRFYPK